MADEEHLAFLGRGVEVWNTWRNANPDIKPDLSGATLVGYDLRKLDLHSANLQKTNFHRSNLAEANFQAASAEGSGFSFTMLWGADFQDSDLRKSNMNMACLYKANLEGANLSLGNLNGTILGNANMKRTSLIEANIADADLHDSSLENAYLTAAYLTRSNLNGVNLSGAWFNYAKMAYTGLGNVDLSQAKGLESVVHEAASSIGIDSLYKSGGNIPETFLRGCGLPDNMIIFAKSLVGNALDFYSCFISYSHADKDFARRMHDRLQGEGIRCWLDEKEMNPGDDIYDEIEHGIHYWDKVLLCCSEYSLKSWWVDNEIDTAFEKERYHMKERGKKVLALIPLDLDGHLFSDDFASGKKQQLHSRIAADFKGWKHDNDIFEREIKKVIRAMQTDGGKAEPPPSKL